MKINRRLNNCFDEKLINQMIGRYKAVKTINVVDLKRIFKITLNNE